MSIKSFIVILSIFSAGVHSQTYWYGGNTDYLPQPVGGGNYYQRTAVTNQPFRVVMGFSGSTHKSVSLSLEEDLMPENASFTDLEFVFPNNSSHWELLWTPKWTGVYNLYFKCQPHEPPSSEMGWRRMQVTVTGSDPVASPTPVTNPGIDGEDAVYNTSSWELTDNGKTYHSFTQGTGLVLPSIVNDGRVGSHSIAIKLLKWGDSNGVGREDGDFHLGDDGRQRNEIKWIEDTIPFRTEKYVGFSMKLNVTSTWTPNSSPIVMQCHQHGPYSPPLSLQIWNDGGERYLGLYILNKYYYYPDSANGNPGLNPGFWPFKPLEDLNHQGLSHCISHFNIDNHLGKWIDIVVGFKFEPDSANSMVKLWINGKRQPLKDLDNNWISDRTYKQELGIPGYLWGDGPIGSYSWPVNQTIPEIRFGIYRAMNATDELEIYYDQVRLGDSYYDVNPRPDLTPIVNLLLLE